MNFIFIFPYEVTITFVRGTWVEASDIGVSWKRRKPILFWLFSWVFSPHMLWLFALSAKHYYYFSPKNIQLNWKGNNPMISFFYNSFYGETLTFLFFGRHLYYCFYHYIHYLNNLSLTRIYIGLQNHNFFKGKQCVCFFSWHFTCVFRVLV